MDLGKAEKRPAELAYKTYVSFAGQFANPFY